MIAALLAVADAIDRTGPIVGDEDRSILVEDDVVGTAQEVLVALDPAIGKDLLLGILAVGIGRDANDASALILMPIPRAVFGDQDRVLVLGRELVAGIELHAERSDVRTEIEHGRRELRALVTHRELRIRHVA